MRRPSVPFYKGFMRASRPRFTTRARARLNDTPNRAMPGTGFSRPHSSNLAAFRSERYIYAGDYSLFCISASNAKRLIAARAAPIMALLLLSQDHVRPPSVSESRSSIIAFIYRRGADKFWFVGLSNTIKFAYRGLFKNGNFKSGWIEARCY